MKQRKQTLHWKSPQVPKQAIERKEEGTSRANIIVLLLLLIIFVLSLYVIYSSSGSYDKLGPKAPKRVSETSTAEPSKNEEDSCDALKDIAKEVGSSTDTVSKLYAVCIAEDPLGDSSGTVLLDLPLALYHTREVARMMTSAVKLHRDSGVAINFAQRMAEASNSHECILILELFLELKLHLDSWHALVESIIEGPQDKWKFLSDVDVHITDILLTLQECYMDNQEIVKSEHMYRLTVGVLTGTAEDIRILRKYSHFALGLGEVYRSVEQVLSSMVSIFVFEGMGNRVEAEKVVLANSVRLFASGFPMHVIAMTQSLAVNKHNVWQVIMSRCNIMEDEGMLFDDSFYVLRLRNVVNVFASCTLHHNVVERLVEKDGLIYASNIFGWTPFLQSVLLGSGRLVEEMLRLTADQFMKTELKQNAFHLIAMNGNYNLIPVLLEAGINFDDRDFFNRTPVDIACLQGQWSTRPLVEYVGLDLPPNCPKKPQYHQGITLGNGGWYSSHVSLPDTLVKEGCDIDVVVDLPAERFLYEYLVIQKPVLIRNAWNTTAMNTFLSNLERSTFEAKFGNLEMSVSDIPVAKPWGRQEEYHSVKQFLLAMKRLQSMKRFTKDSDQDYLLDVSYTTMYWVETEGPGNLQSPLFADFHRPAVVNSELTYINDKGSWRMLELGPTLSGSNMKYGKNAWDLLVYGRRHWFLLPPPRAYFTSMPVWEWWKGEYGNEEPALECVQRAGDLLYLPELWSRAYINLRESIGVNQEFIHGASEFSI